MTLLSFSATRRQVLTGIGALSGLTAIGATSSFAEDPIEIQIGEGTVPDYTHFYVADDLALWSKQGLKATSTMFPSGRIALDALVSGQVKIATCSETPVMFAAINEIPVRVIASVIKYEPFDLVVGPNIKSLDEIRAKRIGYSQGTTAHYYLANLLKSKGLTAADIAAVNLPVANFVPSLVGGAIDAFVWSEPLVSAALKQGPFNRLRSEGLYSAYGCVVAMQSIVDSQPEMLIRAVRTLMSAHEVVKNTPEQAMDIVSAKLKLERSSVPGFWKDLHFGDDMNPTSMTADLTKEAEWAFANNLVKPGAKMPSFDQVVTDSIVKRI
jgi:ABC-type nitrate/sulfonate/bicarbonate transport system substrate-binding protein